MKRPSPNHAISWSEVKRPIVCLAPMDGVTNSAFRQIVRTLSKDVILFSEFTSVDGLVRSEHVRLRLDYEPCEQPFFMQLFGNSPKMFAEAARMVADRGIWGVDINMGCPAKKIVHSQHGSALMQDVDTGGTGGRNARRPRGLRISHRGCNGHRPRRRRDYISRRHRIRHKLRGSPNCHRPPK